VWRFPVFAVKLAIPNSQLEIDPPMRGPYERLKYDLRRGWECPLCHRKEKADFLITNRFCSCRQKKEGGPLVSMKLVDDGVRRVWTHPKMIAAQQATAERLAAEAAAASGEQAADELRVDVASSTEVPPAEDSTAET
jgi:hypothetical protein